MECYGVNLEYFEEQMFEEYCGLIEKPYSDIPEYISKSHKKVVDMYTEKSAKVKYMHDMYSR